MSIYQYALICYGVTAAISFVVMGIVVGLNKVMNKLNIRDDD